MKHVETFGILLLFLILNVPSSFAIDQKLFVYDIEGNASFTYRNVSKPLKTETVCVVDSTIKTDKNSKVTLALPGLLGIWIMENSECTFLSEDPTTVHIKIAKGSMLINTKEPPPSTTIDLETPSAIGRIERFKTKCIVAVTPRPDNTVQNFFGVREGRIDVTLTESHTGLGVTDGQAVDFSSTEYTVPLRNLSYDEENTLADATNVIIVEPEEDEGL